MVNTGMQGLSPFGFGLGAGGDAPLITPSGPSSNPNLLLFPEAFDNTAWSKANSVITPNPGDLTHPTADRVVMSGGAGIVAQASTTAAVSGASVSHGFSFAGVWERQGVTGTFDGLAYTFSLEFLGLGGEDILLVINRVGGVLKVSFSDASELNPTFLVDNAKLEQSASFSGYP